MEYIYIYIYIYISYSYNKTNGPVWVEHIVGSEAFLMYALVSPFLWNKFAAMLEFLMH